MNTSLTEVPAGRGPVPAGGQPANRWRGPANAWFFDTFDRYVNHVSAPQKRAAFEGIEPGRIVEIGAGTGANLRYVPTGATLVAVEPNVAMYDRLRRRAAAAGVELELLATGAEHIPIPDESVDDVICSLVLCTVNDPSAVLTEVRRILRPGGSFRFIEHVAAQASSPRRWLQSAIRRPWQWIFEGCDVTRHTSDVVHNAGFRQVIVERGRLRRSMFVPVNSVAWGIATK